MTAVAVELPLEVPRLRPVPEADVERWELHSELALVSPEVRARALELLPERDPDAFLARTREPMFLPARTADEAQLNASLAADVFRYAFWRLVQTARCGLVAAGALVALASLAEVVH